MNKLPFYFFAGLLTLLFSCAPTDIQKESSINPDDILLWTDTTILSWNDFQGKPAKEAKASSELVIQLPVKFHEAKFLTAASATVECYVDKKASWVKMSQAKPQLLFYNQTLFNLYEVYARKLRKNYTETDFSIGNPVGLLDSIYQARTAELSKVAARYRRESGTGTKNKKIKEWSDKITVELKELEEYKSQ
jgi:hypothetical protein